MKRWMVLALVCCATLANAQSTPAKKELVAKLLALQLSGVEGMAKNLAERPLMTLGQQAGQALQTVAPDKREATAKSIDADFKQYLEEATPLIRDRATKLAPGSVGPIMEEKLSEDELKQLIAWLESPARKKYEQMWPELQSALLQKLVAEVSPALDPKLAALQDKVGNTLRAAGAKIAPKAQASKAAASGARPAAKPASK